MYIGNTLHYPFIVHCECGFLIESIGNVGSWESQYDVNDWKKSSFKLQNVFTSCVICQSPNFLIMVIRACLCTNRMYMNSRENARWSIVMLCIWPHAYLSIFNSPHWDSWAWQDEPNPHPQFKGTHSRDKKLYVFKFFRKPHKIMWEHLKLFIRHC
jgi:hypothetical protein